MTNVRDRIPFCEDIYQAREDGFATIMKPKMSQFELAGRPMLPKEIEMITHSNEGRESVSEKIYDRNVYLDTKMAILKWWENYVLEGHRIYCASRQEIKKAA